MWVLQFLQKIFVLKGGKKKILSILTVGFNTLANCNSSTNTVVTLSVCVQITQLSYCKFIQRSNANLPAFQGEEVINYMLIIILYRSLICRYFTNPVLEISR